MYKVIGWDGADRYLLVDEEQLTRDRPTARIVDVVEGRASPEQTIDNVLSQTDADEFVEPTGPRAAEALALVL